MIACRKSLFLLTLAYLILFSIEICAKAPVKPESSLVEYIPNGDRYTVGDVEFYDCKLSDESGRLTKRAQCAMHAVPENYDQPNNKQVNLFIVRFPARSPTPQPDPVTLLAGGPGGAASESYLNAEHAFGKVLKDRDIYLIDQRGTGKSNKFTCEAGDALDMQSAFDAELVRRLAGECLESFSGDARFYTSSVAVKDLDHVRRALGLAQWNLYGASYGTRMALHYLRRYEAHTRTVILDALVHPELNLGPAVPLESQRALEQMISACEALEACRLAFPQFKQGVFSLIKTLKQGPVDIKYEDFSSGQIKEMSYSLGHLVMFIRMSLYHTMSVSLLPVVLHEAYANKNFSPLARQTQIIQNQMTSAISIGMHFSVSCAEDVPFIDESALNRETLENTYMGPDIVDVLKTVCEVWPRGPMDNDFKQAVKSEVPVLMLSGSIDPITPPEYAEQAAKHLPNSLHLVNEGQGHGQAAVGCMPTVMAKFIESATVNELKTECLKKQMPDPFFVNFNGPSP